MKFARAVLRARPTALQLRAKELPARDVLALLRAVGPMCRSAGTWLVANDRADLAVLTACDCVHIGQDDIAIERVRRIAPGLRVGVSTHTPDQLEKALEARPDYVAYGPVFATTSKKNADTVVGLEGLRVARAMALAAGIPLVAIGGITVERARDVQKLADAGAVIGALFAGGAAASDFEDVTRRACALHAALSPPPASEARP